MSMSAEANSLNPRKLRDLQLSSADAKLLEDFAMAIPSNTLSVKDKAPVNLSIRAEGMKVESLWQQMVGAERAEKEKFEAECQEHRQARAEMDQHIKKMEKELQAVTMKLIGLPKTLAQLEQAKTQIETLSEKLEAEMKRARTLQRIIDMTSAIAPVERHEMETQTIWTGVSTMPATGQRMTPLKKDVWGDATLRDQKAISCPLKLEKSDDATVYQSVEEECQTDAVTVSEATGTVRIAKGQFVMVETAHVGVSTDSADRGRKQLRFEDYTYRGTTFATLSMDAYAWDPLPACREALDKIRWVRNDPTCCRCETLEGHVVRLCGALRRDCNKGGGGGDTSSQSLKNNSRPSPLVNHTLHLVRNAAVCGGEVEVLFKCLGDADLLELWRQGYCDSETIFFTTYGKGSKLSRDAFIYWIRGRTDASPCPHGVREAMRQWVYDGAPEWSCVV